MCTLIAEIVVGDLSHTHRKRCCIADVEDTGDGHWETEAVLVDITKPVTAELIALRRFSIASSWRLFKRDLWRNEAFRQAQLVAPIKQKLQHDICSRSNKPATGVIAPKPGHIDAVTTAADNSSLNQPSGVPATAPAAPSRVVAPGTASIDQAEVDLHPRHVSNQSSPVIAHTVPPADFLSASIPAIAMLPVASLASDHSPDEGGKPAPAVASALVPSGSKRPPLAPRCNASSVRALINQQDSCPSDSLPRTCACPLTSSSNPMPVFAPPVAPTARHAGRHLAPSGPLTDVTNTIHSKPASTVLVAPAIQGAYGIPINSIFNKLYETAVNSRSQAAEQHSAGVKGATHMSADSPAGAEAACSHGSVLQVYTAAHHMAPAASAIHQVASAGLPGISSVAASQQSPAVATTSAALSASTAATASPNAASAAAVPLHTVADQTPPLSAVTAPVLSASETASASPAPATAPATLLAAASNATAMPSSGPGVLSVEVYIFDLCSESLVCLPAAMLH